MKGIIVKSISDIYTVKIGDSYLQCKAKGKFRNENVTPMVGDNVIVDTDKEVIIEILPQTNKMVRPPISNVDQVLIITSVVDPSFATNFLDKLLIISSYSNIEPIICLTKMDLITLKDKRKMKLYIKYYKKIGYKVFFNNEVSKLKKIFKNKITVLAGQSGVGKSTLLNKLDNTLDLKTGVVSRALKRGKHTTRHSELFNLFGGLIADTPGFTSLDFIDMSRTDIRDNVIEFNKYKDGCEYQDCFHINESNCKIKEMVNKSVILGSRYENYKKFVANKEV